MTDAIGAVYREIPSMTPPEIATYVEDLDYDSLWLSEGWGRNTVAVLAEIAAETDSLTLGTAILNVFSRSPALLAATGSTLQRISDGRFVLGLGTSHAELVESLHGVPFERPVRRIHETIELVQEFTQTDADEVTYEGEIFSVEGHGPLEADFPVYNAALGPANRRVTGTLCDGWVPNQIPVSQLETDFERIAEAATDAGRSPAKISVSPWIPAIVTENGADARDKMRKAIAGYVGRFGNYQNAVAGSYESEVDQITSAWAKGDTDRAAAAVSDALVDDMGIAGSPEQGRERLRKIVRLDVVDRPILTVPIWVDTAVVRQTLSELAPSNL